MSDVFVITWSSDYVELRQVTSTGIWQPHTPPIRTYKLNRPTRPERLFSSDSGGGFYLALTDVFSDIEIDQPVWLLLPHNWIQTFHVQNPNFPNMEMQKAHLIWEAQQRLSSNIINYRILLPEDVSTPKITIHMVRDDIVETYVKAAEDANLEIAGIGCEPEWDTAYNFEVPQDLRDAIPADLLYAEHPEFDNHVSPMLSISLGVVVLLMALYIWLIPVDYTKTSLPVVPKKKTEIAIKDSVSLPIAKTDVLPETKVVEQQVKIEEPKKELSWFQKIFGSKDDADKGKKVKETEVVPDIPPVVTESISPVKQVVKNLPTEAVLQIAVITPFECRMEISGLVNPDAWIENLKQTTSQKQVNLIGKYASDGKQTSVIRIPTKDFKPEGKSKDIDQWKELTQKAGMNAKGRNASGTQDQALQLIESVWDNPAGFEKVYLISSKGHWEVTVQ
ncbi:hypothetical protein K9N50_11855 [bacterium]|nr:hypothetical protein [bacterium]